MSCAVVRESSFTRPEFAIEQYFMASFSVRYAAGGMTGESSSPSCRDVPERAREEQQEHTCDGIDAPRENDAAQSGASIGGRVAPPKAFSMPQSNIGAA